MVAMSAEYRVKSRNNTSPRECLKDGKSAIRWIRQHALELGIDPNRLSAGGGSAGGQVAAATGTTQGFEEEGENLNISSSPNALVLFNPVFDNGPNGYGYDRVKAYWKEFSPLRDLHLYQDQPHGFFNFKNEVYYIKTVLEMDRFLVSLGYLKGKPTLKN
jgi:dienelactone hydrolase